MVAFLRELLKCSIDCELEILRCLALGLKTSEISESLRLTSEAARTNVKNIFRKIGVKSRTQAVVWAIGRGLVKPEEAGH
jgi:DNA-binding NarL/FixJ family response regulator